MRTEFEETELSGWVECSYCGTRYNTKQYASCPDCEKAKRRVYYNLGFISKEEI